MFWVRIRLGRREYLGVLDTGATISIVAKKILPYGSLKNTMTTAAIRMGDGHVVHSCGDCEVEVPMGSRTIAHRFYVMDTDAFDFVLGTDFFVQHSQIQSLTLQAPYLLYVDHGSGREPVPLEQSEHTSSYLRLSKEEPSNMMAASKTEDYQLLGEVLDQGPKEFVSTAVAALQQRPHRPHNHSRQRPHRPHNHSRAAECSLDPFSHPHIPTFFRTFFLSSSHVSVCQLQAPLSLMVARRVARACSILTWVARYTEIMR